jgi:hypothetical protein
MWIDGSSVSIGGKRMSETRDGRSSEHDGMHRRGFFGRVAGGVYASALTSLLSRDLYGADVTSDLRPRPPHFEPKAKAVIHLFMNGGPSPMDLFDPKPVLAKRHGEPLFDKIAGEVENAKNAGTLLRSPFKFKRRGECGMWVSDALPHIAQQVDDIALIRSLYTTNLTHEPAIYLIQTGKTGPGRPSLGSWVVYGLGSENQDLPAYVVLDDPLGLPINGIENWQAGFLPPVFQGTRFRSTGAPVLNLRPDMEPPREVDRLEHDLVDRLDRIHQKKRPSAPNLGARIASYELAARMQLAASDALDLSRESAETLALYGIGRAPTDSYGRRCLIARRLVERGVRFVQLYINGQIWDNHTSLASDLKSACDRTDLPTAGLLQDLKRRGLFESTLVLWGGEFGRLPIAQLPPDGNATGAGRDHNKNAFCGWMAGAGIRGGTTHGSTDEIGLAAVEGRVSVPDWHATVLHLLGLRYDDLFVETNGLKEKLTSVFEARVVKEILS